MPEKANGINSGNCFEQWLAHIIGKDCLSPLFAVEMAHRVPTRSFPPGAPPRPVILHFKDRDTILWLAQDLPDLKIDNNKIGKYPYFSVEVQQRHMLFMDIKKQLCNFQISYLMIYAAKLCILMRCTSSSCLKTLWTGWTPTKIIDAQWTDILMVISILLNNGNCTAVCASTISCYL